MKLAHFYHAYLRTTAWPTILEEHLWALREAEYDGSLYVTLVGEPGPRKLAEGVVQAVYPDTKFATTKQGWEQVTLTLLEGYAEAHPDDAILYAHTKGAADPKEFNNRWRRSMQRHVVSGWRDCLAALESGEYDAVGCHWLTGTLPAEHETPLFGGNYWMATCAYLATLPTCRMDARHRAESWIGIGDPRVKDLNPGWPSEGSFKAA